ncbi:MAG: amidohydrolase [Actinomycetota bacterium]
MELTVYTARSIVTMNRSWPRAEAVAVGDGRIVEVGTIESMEPWLDRHPHQIDDRFADHVLLPGFIDPHLHPTMAAVLLPMEFVTAMEWKLPWGRVEPVTTPDGFVDRLRALDASRTAAGDNDRPLFVWGYHQLWHGAMSRELLDAVSLERPICVWHRSFHELYLSTAFLDHLELIEARVGGRPGIDWRAGHFYEAGLGYAIAKLNPLLLAPDRYAEGLTRLAEVAHHGGHTTLGDLAVGLFDFETEWEATSSVLGGSDVPFRVELVPSGLGLQRGGRSHADIAEFIAGLPERNTDKLRFGHHVKLFADGAFFSQLAQVGPPGYIDGHHGEWLMAPEQLLEAARVYWNAGMVIHLHVTGDLGLELGLDVLAALQRERPRFEHGFTFEHVGFSTPEQIDRIKALGANVSANVHYLHELGHMYAREGIGFERASQMARLGSCFRAGITTTVHSDFTMAPAEPLNSVWVAVNRVDHGGRVLGQEERLTVEQALAAITINAARVLGRADELGSIRAGKRADFTVLGEDPLAVDPMALKDIDIVATVFDGVANPL